MLDTLSSKNRYLLGLVLFMMTAVNGTDLFGQTAQMESPYQTILSQEFDGFESGAAALVVKQGETLFRGGVGAADIDLKQPITPAHSFRIGSITKTFTAIAILQLAEQGKLNISDPIQVYLPNYPNNEKEINIEHLLTHTSGIKPYTGMAEVAHLQNTTVTPAKIIDVFEDAPLEFTPGERYQYNNYGYILLGAIIEQVSGMSYEAYLEKEIFEPVGMNDTHYGDAKEATAKQAKGYEQNNGDYKKAPYLNMAIPYAAGGLVSTVDDLYKWMEALKGNKVISESGLQKAFSSFQLEPGAFTPYGYGWQLAELYGRQVVGHDGVIQGFLSNMIYLPEEDLFVAVLSNCTCKNPVGLANKLAAFAIGEYPLVTKEALDPNTLDPYVGQYQYEGKRKHEIFHEKGQLYSLTTGDRRRMLYRGATDQFFFEEGLISIEFMRNGAGEVVGLKRVEAGKVVAEAAKQSNTVAQKEAIQLKAKELQKYVGKYDLGPFHLFITLEEDKLFGQPEGQSKEQLFAKAKDHLFLKAVDAEMEFFRKDGQVQAVKVTIGNNSFQGKLVQD
ncbi:MAG: serine hydrolase [Saprospiraceae bacterium]|nr:serine hydrolase [Saprospiraceae bacterium]